VVAPSFAAAVTRVKRIARLLFLSILVIAVVAIGWGVYQRLDDQEAPARTSGAAAPVPVEVVPVERGSIALRRTFTGTLEAPAEFVVAPKIGARLQQLAVDLGDEVNRGAVVARLDDDEFVQEVARAQAELEVAQANRAEAESLLEIAERELRRVQRLRGGGLTSESQLDVATADVLAKRARVKVTDAGISRAEAELEAARIRLGYTQVVADWQGGADRRVVAERYVDEGETVSANTPLLRIVELDPITAVFSVTERDYGLLRVGQSVRLGTDAFPDERFDGVIQRIAPVFREATRQARIEVRVENPRSRLKPGMFVRADVVLERIARAVVVPEEALVRRDDRTGVFIVGADDMVAWRPVEPGVREAGRVQVDGDGLDGLVVVLGQQLLEDGSRVRVANPPEPGSR
jgi:RND family efflux transporter MFP subunit